MSDTENITNQPNSSEEVILTIPCLAEYVGVARLAILGVANRISFSYDEVEDVRLAVGEACGQAIERAHNYLEALNPEEESRGILPIKITSRILDSALNVEIEDHIPPSSSRHRDRAFGDDSLDYMKLGTTLIEILVDEVTVVETASGTTIKLIKTAAASS